MTLSYPTKAKDDAGNPLNTISATPLKVVVKALPYVNELYQDKTIPLIRETENFSLSDIILLARDQYGNPISIPGDLQWKQADNNNTEASIEDGKLMVSEGQVPYASWSDLILESHSPSCKRTAKNIIIRVRQQAILNKLVAYVKENFTPKWQENVILNEYFRVDGFDQYGDPIPTFPIWNSSDLSAVSLEKGILTFLEEDGISIITAKDGDIVSNEIRVTVSGTPRVASITVGGAPSSVNLNSSLELTTLTAKVYDQYGKEINAEELKTYPASMRWTLEKGTSDADISGNTVRFGNKAGTITLVCTVVNSHTNEGLAQERINIEVSTPQVPSSGGGGAISIETVSYNAKLTGGVIDTLPVNFNDGKSCAVLELGGLIKNIISSSKNTIISMPAIGEAKSFTVNIPAGAYDIPTKDTVLIFETSQGSIVIPCHILSDVLKSLRKEIEISLEKADKSDLSEALQHTVGNRPIIRLVLTMDGKENSWEDPNLSIKVSMPYNPKGEELNNTESIVILHSDNGNASCIPSGIYNKNIGAITFRIGSFGRYAVGYKKVNFEDVPRTAWYFEAVNFLASREITSGTNENTFSPLQSLNRGQFITLLLRAYGINEDVNTRDNFVDAGNTYYTKYLAVAKHLGISKGVGSDKFAPEQSISRQEMFTLLYNALKVLDKLPHKASNKTLMDFADAESIEPYAQEAISCLIEAKVIEGLNEK